jgi:hypothetical protein
VIGTVHYASSNLHQRIMTYFNLSTMMRSNLYIGNRFRSARRDDLESLAYTFLWVLRAKFPWDDHTESMTKKLKATITGSVLFSGLPSQPAEFYDFVRGLEYDESPDYDRWQGIYRDLLDPYTRADEPFDFDSAWDIEDVDDDLVDEADWPTFSNSNPVEDDKEDYRRYRRYAGFMPNPAGVKEDLFGDEDKILKGKVDIISTRPSTLEGGYIHILNADYEEMVLI